MLNGKDGQYYQYMVHAEAQMDGCANIPKFNLTVKNFSTGETLFTKTVTGITSATSGTYHLRSGIMIPGNLATAIGSTLTLEITSDTAGNIAYSDIYAIPIGTITV